MPFPLTHLHIAHRILKGRPLPARSAAQFLLGAIAPDAIHYRAEFKAAEMSGIGAAKKLTHLCPVSDEPWGKVTDNNGWLSSVKTFLYGRDDPFAEGYAAHVLTDMHNNRTVWLNFRTSHPDEAAKGYASDYYRDLRNIDFRLFKHEDTPGIFSLLEKSDAADIHPLVTKDEIRAIRHNILHEHFKEAVEGPRNYTYVSYDDMLEFIQSTADFVIEFFMQKSNYSV